MLPALVNNTRSVSSANAISQWPCMVFREGVSSVYHLCVDKMRRMLDAHLPASVGGTLLL
jgi:hypothetical protein